MRILIAPDSFKGTLSADEVCDIIGSAFEDGNENDIIKMPLADGGEGLCSCLERIVPGRMIYARARGVFGEEISAGYLMLDDGTAVIETASVAGLPMAGDRKNPELAVTSGLGDLLSDALEKGAKSILLGLGGSATNDCGTGMAAALGFRFEDESGNEIEPKGANLGAVRNIIPPAKPYPLPVVCACDVENPLHGEKGAAYVFAPQKGADEAMVRRLDGGLKNIASVIEKCLGKKIDDIPGAGAAGGLGAGACAFLGAKLERGIDIILDKAGFDEKAAECDFVITGEGRLDFQSADGKVISGVAKRASALGKPVYALCGCRGEGAERILTCGVSDMFFSCEEAKPFEEIRANCKADLYSAAMRMKVKIV